MTTTNMSLNEPSVGTTAGPTWATEVNENFTTIDQHDHTSGKGVQLTTSALNINADLEFNGNAATELKRLTIDSSATGSGTNYSVYQSGGNLFWYNGSGQAVQITDGSAVKTTGGSISGMSSDAAVQFSVNAYVFKWDTTTSPQSVAKISCSDISIYNFSNYNDLVTLKYTGSGASSELTLPDETGTLLSTATNFAGTINIATSSSNASINLKPNGTGSVAVGNGGASGKLTSNGAFDLVLDTNSGTNSGNITITDAADGNISLTPNGTGEIVIGSGSASGKITSSGAHDLVLDTNSGTNSGSITITDGADGDIAISPNGTGTVVVNTDLDVDNININGNAIISSNTDGNIDLTPNGTGEVNISKVDIDSGTIDGTTIATSNVDVSANTFTTSSAQKQAIVQAGPGSGTFDVSSGTITTSTAQKQAIVDGATIEAQDLASGSGTSLPNNVQDAITRLGTVTSGTLSHGTSLQGYVDASNTGVAFPNGHVIQVVTNPSFNSEGSHSGNMSFVATGIEVDITPRTTSSKFFIIVTTSGYVNGGSTHVGYYTIFRDSTDLGPSGQSGFADLYQGAGHNITPNPQWDMGTVVAISFLDSPSGLSLGTSIKYELYARNSNNNDRVYWSMNGSQSSITVMEIKT